MKLRIKDILDLDDELTFLVGAGCSIDSPSNLPSALDMMIAIIKRTCHKDEQAKILNLIQNGALRFEALVEILQKTVDDNLSVLDFYSECKNPNLQHFFLAEMILKGHILLTTNFDHLIEYALIESGVQKEEIIPIITREDYENFKDPIELISKNKKALYKIHGSTKNIITGQSTRESLIATIQAFALNKEGLSVFQIEPFKKPLFNIASNNRTLVIMGYSGSDDFDIVPTLKSLRKLKSLIWINHIDNDNGNENIIDLSELDETKLENDQKVNQILASINHLNHIKNVYRVDVNTSRFVNNLITLRPHLANNDLPLNPLKWLKSNIKIEDKLDFMYVASRIYYQLNLHEDGMRCAKKLLKFAREKGDTHAEFVALNNIAFSLILSERHTEGYQFLRRALTIGKNLEDSGDKASLFHNLAEHYRREGKDEKALKYYSLSFEMSKRLGNLQGLITIFAHISPIFEKRGEISKAFGYMEEALKLSERLGDLDSRSLLLANYGFLLMKQKKYDKAKGMFEEALVLTEKLGDKVNNAKCYLNLAKIYKKGKDYYKALELDFKALEISNNTEDITLICAALIDIGHMYETLQNFSQAYEYYQKAMNLAIKYSLYESEAYKAVKKNIERIKTKLKLITHSKLSSI